ncbi:nucleosidase [Rhodococcus rhodnii]|uniref:Nucleosidase n=2 Tax=Rhodococcus rhodnii TaxID=38312 RepID=R7WLT4_9NOCA|nr:nucleosidase [Rhodococcus rhodnii]EOM76257.1 nucleosidase [Rhodococcus rhodnii LMG 5362]TXG90736.1 nucleosidase [Rhodococcus rhodnii]
MTRRDVLVVSATAAEAAHVPDGYDVLVTGIGKVASASAVAAALASRDTPPEWVVNIGTVGALHAHHSGMFVPSRVLNHDISADVLRSMGYDAQDTLDVAGGDGSVLATGDVFVSEAAVRDELARRADLVDMEGFAIAWACARASVPCRLVKHVSDGADESALSWAQVVDASAGELARWLTGRFG